jgi:hypothetical protein
MMLVLKADSQTHLLSTRPVRWNGFAVARLLPAAKEGSFRWETRLVDKSEEHRNENLARHAQSKITRIQYLLLNHLLSHFILI